VAPDHEWEAVVYSRTFNGAGCPLCARSGSTAVSVTNSLASLYPDAATEWHPTKNEGLKPEDVRAGSGKKVWWKCDKGPDHEWEAAVNSRARSGYRCPICSGRKVSVSNSLAFLDPALASDWHPTKNGARDADACRAALGDHYTYARGRLFSGYPRTRQDAEMPNTGPVDLATSS
jgi:hypothetical protein